MRGVVGKLVARRCSGWKMRRFSSLPSVWPGAGFDDQSGEEVVGAGVRLAGAGGEQGRVGDGDLDEPARRPAVA